MTVRGTGLKEALTFIEHVRKNLNKEFIIIIIILSSSSSSSFQSNPLYRAETWILNAQQVNKLLVTEMVF